MRAKVIVIIIAAVTRMTPYPMKTKIPLSSRSPKEMRKIPQAAVKFESGIGSGRARKIPSNAMTRPLTTCMMD